MRLWSLHPKYLDAKGIVALWREALLAKNVLKGNTKGYKNHPQLERFKATNYPIDAINEYLSIIYFESQRRLYSFDKNKIEWGFKHQVISLNNKQLDYEFQHLLNKLKTRDKEKYKMNLEIIEIEVNPMFNIVSGEVEYWEIV